MGGGASLDVLIGYLDHVALQVLRTAAQMHEYVFSQRFEGAIGFHVARVSQYSQDATHGCWVRMHVQPEHSAIELQTVLKRVSAETIDSRKIYEVSQFAAI